MSGSDIAQRVYLDRVVNVDDVAAIKSRRRQRRNMNDVVVERVVTGFHLAARDAEYVAFATVLRALRPHVNYLSRSPASAATCL